MRNLFLMLTSFTFALFSAQTGKVGINTISPTENIDVNGTLRVRFLPVNGTANSIYTTGTDSNSGSTPNQTFTAVNTIVADANGVLGVVQGLPPISNTVTYIAPTGGFPFNDSATNSAYTIALGPLTVSFYQKSNNNNNKFNFSIKSSNANDSYIINLRRMTTTTTTLSQLRGTLTTNTWQEIGTTANEHFTAGYESWHINIYLKSVDRIFRVTLISAASSSSSTATGDQITMNIQEL